MKTANSNEKKKKEEENKSILLRKVVCIYNTLQRTRSVGPTLSAIVLFLSLKFFVVKNCFLLFLLVKTLECNTSELNALFGFCANCNDKQKKNKY